MRFGPGLLCYHLSLLHLDLSIVATRSRLHLTSFSLQQPFMCLRVLNISLDFFSLDQTPSVSLFFPVFSL